MLSDLGPYARLAKRNALNGTTHFSDAFEAILLTSRRGGQDYRLQRH